MPSDAVLISLTPGECRTLNRQCVRAFGNHPDAQALLDRLHDAEALAMWLRDLVQIDLHPSEASLLRDLWEIRRTVSMPAEPLPSAILASDNMTV